MKSRGSNRYQLRTNCLLINKSVLNFVLVHQENFFFKYLRLNIEVINYANNNTQNLTLTTWSMRPDELKLSKENYGSVKRVFLVSKKNLIGNTKFQRWMIENYLPDYVLEIE